MCDMKSRWYMPLGVVALGVSGVQADEPLSQNSRWGLGDWGGARKELLESGYDFQLDYVGEAAANVAGGYNHDRTARYTSQWAIGTHLDLQKILGLPNAEFKFTVTERDGNNLSQERLSDPRTGQLSSVQEVWGRGQTWRLTQLWFRQRYLDGALDLKIGRFGENEDFNSFPCDFQSLAFCSAPVGNYAGDVWYSWPVSQWAGRVRYNFNANWYAQIGVFEQNPSLLERNNGFKLNSSGTKGALIPVEVVWQPNVGPKGLAGEYRLGYYYSTASADDVYEDSTGQSQAQTGQAFKKHGSKHGWWINAQQQVTTHAGDNSRGLSLFANATVHDKSTSRIESYQSVGAVYKGPFDARPLDDIGLGFSRIHVNDDVRQYQREVNARNGITDFDNPQYLPVQHTEYNAELYYGYHLANWMTVRPNVQYVRDPGGVSDVDNAWVAGLKIQASF
jgi:porin